MGLIFVVNCGSSSLKFTLINPEDGKTVAYGLAERLGTPEAVVNIRQPVKLEFLVPNATHGDALDKILSHIDGDIVGVGHRIVHGGEYFTESVLVDDKVVELIGAASDLAPLHNPAHVMGIEAARKKFPDLPHVVVFDTAFHQTMPKRAYLYALPYSLYTNEKVRKYGFHGTSHRYVASEAAKLIGKPLEDLHLITMHLGNGSSTCAVRNGKSYDTSMGLTPLEGLIMGTRSGDVDANLHEYLTRRTGCTLSQVTAMVNRESGLLGISGLSNDMRTLAEAAASGHQRAALAIDMFCFRLAKHILGMSASLDRIDALIFTGGIGENSALVREKTLSFLSLLRPQVDSELNNQHGRPANGRITAAESPVLAMVVPTNEELVIARETARFVPALAS